MKINEIANNAFEQHAAIQYANMLQTDENFRPAKDMFGDVVTLYHAAMTRKMAHTYITREQALEFYKKYKNEVDNVMELNETNDLPDHEKVWTYFNLVFYYMTDEI